MLPGVRAVAPGADVVELHGSLDAGGQDAALRQTGGRRVILATNIAETSLTVPGVSAVVDTGLQKLPRYDVERGFDHLRLERITQDSADQRAGRAGRLGPGIAVRLWDQRDRLRPHREPDIARIDLAAPVLDVLAWGGDPGRFEWFEAPSPEMLEAALALLRRLRALDDGRLTSLGERLRGLPLHPRLGAVLIEGGGSFEAAAACALLADGVRGRASTGATTTSDVLSALDAWTQQPVPLRQAAEQLVGLAREWPDEDRREHVGEAALRRALLAGYPDRVARRREAGSPRLLLATGAGAELARDSGVRDAEWLVALDVAGAVAGGDARVFAASAIEREWLEPTRTSVEHTLSDQGRVRATRVTWYDALRLTEAPVAADPAAAAVLLAEAYLARAHDDATTQLLRRLRYIGADVDLPALVAQAASGARSVSDIDLGAHLPWHVEIAPRPGRPGTARRPQRAHGRARLPRRRQCRRLGEVAGAVWPGRDATHRTARRAGAAAAAGAQRPARCRRRVTCGASGSAPIPRCGRSCEAATPASVARRPVDGDSHRADQAERDRT